ncbi:MAG: hypothetical protein EOP35_12170 [Rubrivivax sp.]|nr:MAG: hypothetical protein EOP35_12170 [Rubrivivax sp.]
MPSCRAGTEVALRMAMRLRVTDSVTTRLVAVQVLIVVLVVICLAVFWNYERDALLAEPMAAMWAPRLQQARAADILSRSDDDASDAADTARLLRLRASAPPDVLNVTSWPAAQRLQEALARHGVAVDQLLLRRGEAGLQLWLRLPATAAQPAPRWLSPTDAPLTGLVGWRALLGLGLLMGVVVPLNLRFVRRLTTPIAVLSRRWAGTGAATLDVEPLPVLDASAPIELRALDAAFARYAGQLLRIERERAMLLAGVSHDMRSPLARIRLAAELLPETPPNASGVATITRNVDLADRLIASFLEFVRSGDQPLDETVDLADTVRHAVAGFGRPEALLQVEAPPRLALQRASRLLLERVVVNLIDNALKHGRPPVRLTLRLDGDAALLSITDQGAGIPDADVDGLMSAFARGDASRGLPGFGLGLAIVQQVVTRHQGSVRFVRQPVGQRVELRLPLDRAVDGQPAG